MQSDVIENLGAIKGERVRELANTLSGYLDHPSDHIEAALDEMIAEGLLSHEASGEGTVWRWARVG
jgi:hypothetical protein